MRAKAPMVLKRTWPCASTWTRVCRLRWLRDQVRQRAVPRATWHLRGKCCCLLCRGYCDPRGTGRLAKYCALAAARACGSFDSCQPSVLFGHAAVVWLQQGREWAG